MRGFLKASWRKIKAMYIEWRSAFFVILLFLILWGLFRPEPSKPQLAIEPLETLVEETLPTSTQKPPSIRSYITGAVAYPGVYSMTHGSILQDLVLAAGGFVHGAQEEAINLALEIMDQGHYHVPREEEESSLQLAQATQQNEASQGGLVNLNTAGLAELQALNGIGPALAQRILDWRDSYGPFKAKDELMLVPGIKEAKYQALEHQLATIH